MPVPKQKQGRIRTHTRRSANMKISAAAQSTCPRCGAVKLPHHVCPSCGFYKDREVIVRDFFPPLERYTLDAMPFQMEPQWPAQ